MLFRKEEGVDITPFIGPIVTVALAVATAYVATNAANNRKFEELRVQNAEQTALIRALKETVDRHNSIVERTFKLETEMKTAWVRIDELKEHDARIEEKLDHIKVGGTE